MFWAIEAIIQIRPHFTTGFKDMPIPSVTLSPRAEAFDARTTDILYSTEWKNRCQSRSEMDIAKIAREMASLPPEAQKQIVDFLAFLKARYPSAPAAKKAKTEQADGRALHRHVARPRGYARQHSLGAKAAPMGARPVSILTIVDTDILIDVARNTPEAVECLAGIQEHSVAAISVITQMELLAGCRNKAEQRHAERFISDSMC